MSRIVNINVGILGHVDSGKTSLARALSTQFSTAALDKNPQSVERGITLDLGFSSFITDIPDELKEAYSEYDKMQFTLVDCPGHASLIRTIIGGAQIIDLMMLVVDVNKGVQTQTAECLVVGEILTQSMVVVLNKCDLLEEGVREEKVGKMKQRLARTLAGTKFGGCSMAAVAARPGGADDMTLGVGAPAEGLEELTKILLSHVPKKPRPTDGSFLFAVDHCFPIKGQGTVITGTVLQGSVAVNQNVELPLLRTERKVKSMQMFRKPVQQARAGDRLGICVTQLDAKQMERGLLSEPKTVPTIVGAVAAVEKIRFFKGSVTSKSKFHVTIGHATVMAEVFIFTHPQGAAAAAASTAAQSVDERARTFSFDNEYAYQSELLAKGQKAKGEEESEDENLNEGPQYAVLMFDQPVTCPEHSLLIGARFDADIHSNACRLAFHGRLGPAIDPKDAAAMSGLRIYKIKKREGSIDRVNDKYTVIGKGMFKKETDISLFTGMKVSTASGAVGTIVSSFGKSGKYKVNFPDGLPENSGDNNNKLTMNFKRYVFDKSKKMIQL